jgi:hypothetical protein
MPYVYQKNAAGHYVCPTCGATKQNQNTMHYHLKRHEATLPFACGHCGKEFLLRTTLELHVRARHSREEAARIPCPATGCSFATPSAPNLLKHYVRHHCVEAAARLRDESGGCRACGKVCKSPGAFVYHAATSGCLQEPTLIGLHKCLRNHHKLVEVEAEGSEAHH